MEDEDDDDDDDGDEIRLETAALSMLLCIYS